MTDRAERIREAHRGSRYAEPASATRLNALERNGLKFESINGFDYLVEDEFYFNTASGFWRHVDDDDKRGYTVPALAQHIRLSKNRNSAFLAVASDIEKFAEALPLAPESLPIGVGIRQSERDDTQPRDSSCVLGEARSASSETGPGANAGMNVLDAYEDAAVDLHTLADSRNLLPEVMP